MRWMVLALAVVLACGDDDGGVDAAADAGVDTGSDSVDAGEDAGEDGGADAALPETDEAALLALTDALGIAASFAGPLVGDAEQLRDEGGRLDGMRRERMTRDRVENAVSGNSIVTDAGCTVFEWSGLSVTATFTDCVLELIGETLSGAATLGVTFHPTTFTLSFDALAIGPRTVDGMLSLNVGGECGGDAAECTSCPDGDTMCAEERAMQRTLTGSLTIENAGTTTLAIDTLTLTYEADVGATASGSGTLDGTAIVATDVMWNIGECLPSSGTLELPDSSTTITFLPTTPTTGEVNVQVGPFPAFEQMVFPACP